jgi:hypothetical protein
MAKAREQLLGATNKRLDPLLVHHALATWTFDFSTKPSVSTRRWRFVPMTFLGPS